METEVEVVDLHLLDVDQGEDELVVHVLQQMDLQPGQQLPDRGFTSLLDSLIHSAFYPSLPKRGI